MKLPVSEISTLPPSGSIPGHYGARQTDYGICTCSPSVHRWSWLGGWAGFTLVIRIWTPLSRSLTQTTLASASSSWWMSSMQVCKWVQVCKWAFKGNTHAAHAYSQAHYSCESVCTKGTCLLDPLCTRCTPLKQWNDLCVAVRMLMFARSCLHAQVLVELGVLCSEMLSWGRTSKVCALSAHVSCTDDYGCQSAVCLCKFLQPSSVFWLARGILLNLLSCNLNSTRWSPSSCSSSLPCFIPSCPVARAVVAVNDPFIDEDYMAYM
jgi:hypothetical protein